MGLYNVVSVAPGFGVPSGHEWQSQSDFPVGELCLAPVYVTAWGELEYILFYDKRLRRVTESGVLNIYDYLRTSPVASDNWLEYDLTFEKGHLVRVFDIENNRTIWERIPL